MLVMGFQLCHLHMHRSFSIKAGLNDKYGWVFKKKKKKDEEGKREREMGEDFLLAGSNLAAAQAPILKSH